jgi:uncharacterized membrane protein
MLNTPFRSAISFFLLTFSTAFLMTVGMRMTGWFTRAPQITIQENMVLGVCIMVAVTSIAIGAFLHRMEMIELRSALLGAASVLLALPLSEAAINQTWSLGTTIVTALGFISLGIGLLVSVGLNVSPAGGGAATKS